MTTDQLLIVVLSTVAVLCGVTCLFVASWRQHERAEGIDNQGAAINEQAIKAIARNEDLLKRNEKVIEKLTELSDQWQVMLNRCDALLTRWEGVKSGGDRH